MENPLRKIKEKVLGEQEFKKIEQTPEEDIEKNPMKDLVDETKSGQQEKKRIVVVKELPVQQIRSAKGEDGVTEYYLTIEEALANLMNEGEKE